MRTFSSQHQIFAKFQPDAQWCIEVATLLKKRYPDCMPVTEPEALTKEWCRETVELYYDRHPQFPRPKPGGASQIGNAEKFKQRLARRRHRGSTHICAQCVYWQDGDCRNESNRNPLHDPEYCCQRFKFRRIS